MDYKLWSIMYGGYIKPLFSRHRPEGTEQVFHPKHEQVFIHPDYEFENDFHKNDIALIKLERASTQSESISRVCWHPKDIKEHRNGSFCSV